MTVEQLHDPGATPPTERPSLGQRVAGRIPRGTRAIAWAGILLGLVAAWIALPPEDRPSVFAVPPDGAAAA